MTTLALVHCEPLFVDCPRLDQCGDHCHECDGAGEIAIDLSDLATLAHNLAIAAALCASFEMGRDAGPDRHQAWKTAWWRPGCGKPWSWPHVTRDDGCGEQAP